MYGTVESTPAIEAKSEHGNDCISHANSQSDDYLIGNPATIVLQPSGNLNHESSEHFQRSLEAALDLAGKSVIVDLLWIEAVDAVGIAALVSGVERAAWLKKTLSFQSMRHHTRIAMEREWERQRQQRLGDQRDRFHTCLEQFLESNRRGENQIEA